MKLNKKTLELQRRQLDRKMKALLKFRGIETPATGWLKSIREALGMTASQLAGRMNMAQQSIAQFEKSEMSSSITLKSLKELASSLNCEFKYAFLPNGKYNSLEEILEERALEVARKKIVELNRSMSLEGQKVNKEELGAQIKELALELKNNLSRDLWEKE